DGEPDPAHLGEVGALAAEERLHGLVALGGAVAEAVDVLGHGGGWSLGSLENGRPIIAPPAPPRHRRIHRTAIFGPCASPSSAPSPSPPSSSRPRAAAGAMAARRRAPSPSRSGTASSRRASRRWRR